ncbi:hypothetical protein D3C85_173240 [compost metagenome]
MTESLRKNNYPKDRKSRKTDLTGLQFGYVVVKGFDCSINGSPKWWCVCECGNEISVYASNLRRRPNMSCGCKRSEKLSKTKATKNNASKHPLWGSYNQMIRRCTVEKDKAYRNYGARGITVCERWLESFWNFVEDMGERPKGTSLERKDNSLGYSPDNCMWETKSRQQFNRRMDPNNTTGRTGVYWRKDRETWSVQIDVEGETIRLGCYKDFNQACKVREEAELKYFGFIKE